MLCIFLANTLFSFSGDSLTYLLTVMIITKLVIITSCCLAVKLCLILLQLHGLCSPPSSSVHEETRILPRQKYWRGCHFLFQGIFPIQGLNPGLLHWEADSLPLSYQGSSSIINYNKILIIIIITIK